METKSAGLIIQNTEGVPLILSENDILLLKLKMQEKQKNEGKPIISVGLIGIGLFVLNTKDPGAT